MEPRIHAFLAHAGRQPAQLIRLGAVPAVEVVVDPEENVRKAAAPAAASDFAPESQARSQREHQGE